MTRQIEIDGGVYDVDRAYRAGVRASREGVPYHVANPYRAGSKASWHFECGYDNEEDGAHVGPCSIRLRRNRRESAPAPD